MGEGRVLQQDGGGPVSEEGLRLIAPGGSERGQTVRRQEEGGLRHAKEEAGNNGQLVSRKTTRLRHGARGGGGGGFLRRRMAYAGPRAYAGSAIDGERSFIFVFL